MENLLVLLDKIQQVSPLPIFSQEVVIVQNAGMQHWLNLSLAKQRGISMNIRYALPSQFLWKLIRTLASDEYVPDQSPYSREVLTWRIHSILISDKVVNDPVFEQANNYWQGKTSQETSLSEDQGTESNQDEKSSLKRYQLACQLADLYEQYLIFRPEWVDVWSHGNLIENISDSHVQDIANWQGKLWYLLTQEQAYNPVILIQQALENLADKASVLPKRISFFGINVMAPIWLSFINEVSDYVDIHFFHLNPCYAYWGDILSEKQAIKSISKWIAGHDDISQEVGNPLLANLGQQGREFMALLHGYSTINIDVFELASNDALVGTKHNVLTQVQHDILSLTDARTKPSVNKDDSIVITSCHSALREVQGLHDWLLHQFNNDPLLTPKDVLVMCPQVEQYAPYVNAVFTRGWQDFDDKVPPLPCSIADRVSKDCEPIVAAFSELLNLPDSRFQVSQLIGLLRLPAMQSKFKVTIEEIDKISIWLQQAAIHWGLDQTHKQQILNTENASNNFTWQQGLSRLLKGFAFGDKDVIYQDQLLLPTVEGSDGLLLGKLMLIIEQLQRYAVSLSSPKDAMHWQSFLFELINELFVTDDDVGFAIVYQVIESLVEHCEHANFEEKIELAIVRDFLNHHFSQPDPGRQFIVGQVTFCSMLPMRSIPFKIIAVLGLNDGEFPRQRQPLGFDLMSETPVKLGDRSRRGDDRYLFLEAIISARQALYLSYQGRNIKNNSPKQASLVLKELMEYLKMGYGWNLLADNEDENTDLRQLAMQPFSEQNYQGNFGSFDKNWLKLSQESRHQTEPLFISDNMLAEHTSETQEDITLDVALVISFFQHPAKIFAQQQLNLYFEQRDIELDDIEPFDHDRLQSYLLRQQLLSNYLAHSDDETALSRAINNTITSANLTGKFPEAATTALIFENWRQDSEVFSQVIINHQADKPTDIDCSITLAVAINNSANNIKVNLKTKMPVKEDKLVFYRSSSAKAKDFLTLYLHQLIIQVWQQQYNMKSNNLCIEQKNETSSSINNKLALNNIQACHGFYFDTKTQKATQFRYSNIEDPQGELIRFIEIFFTGKQQALLLNGELAEKYFKTKMFEQTNFEMFWSDPNAMSFSDDPYMHYFWPECPVFAEHQQQLIEVYQTMLTTREVIKS